MRTAVRTQEIRDVQALKISFVQHSVHEEAIMRRSDFTVGEDSNFSAIDFEEERTVIGRSLKSGSSPIQRFDSLSLID